ncbi:chemotaxis protein CheC [Heliorestis acidaminivorans]|uniref:Chemotaxis protein CheC n=1 Tax=Heliorestis acidaminivorans TaxID=553427 RepID=A0A6I0F0Y8_9FIRM|nr:chemotaxis protein CheC [Heliorestis acidaminivorans]KAB2952984.1 chemotaxis protein CheC [Heliorestis acidaminivorans]
MGDLIKDMAAFHLDVLKEISNIGSGHAATALSQMLGKRVDMQVSRVMPMPFDEITEYVGGAENLITSVFLRFEGDITGNMFFIVDKEDAESLVQDLAGIQVEGDFCEMSLSVLQEVGNILSGSYLTALADFTAMEMKPTVPSLAIDMAGALLSYGLTEIGKSSDYAIMIDAEIQAEGMGHVRKDGKKGKTGHFFLLPDPESFEKVFLALGVHQYGGH